MKLILFLISINVIVPFYLTQAQDINSLFNYAISKYKNKDFEKAINIFHRIIFFDSVGTYLYDSYYLLSLSYFNTNQLKKARENIELAINSAKNDSLRNEALFLLCYYNIYEKNYTSAQFTLLNIDNNNNNYFIKKKNFYSGLIFLKMFAFDSAYNYFLKTIDSSKINDLKSCFNDIKRIDKKYNPSLARIMSMIIPGSGQIFYGYFRDGLNSFLLNSTILFLMFNVYSNISFIDGFVSLFPWYLRYYQGGYENAYSYVKHKKEEKINKIFLEWLKNNKQFLYYY